MDFLSSLVTTPMNVLRWKKYTYLTVGLLNFKWMKENKKSIFRKQYRGWYFLAMSKWLYFLIRMRITNW